MRKRLHAFAGKPGHRISYLIPACLVATGLLAACFGEKAADPKVGIKVARTFAIGAFEAMPVSAGSVHLAVVPVDDGLVAVFQQKNPGGVGPDDTQRLLCASCVIGQISNCAQQCVGAKPPCQPGSVSSCAKDACASDPNCKAARAPLNLYVFTREALAENRVSR